MSEVEAPVFSPMYRWAHQKILAALAEGDEVLEVGCGAGHTARHFHDRRVHMHCADLALGHPELPGVPHTSGANLSGQLPFPDERFEAVFSLEVYEHLPNPVNAIAEYARILRSGGQLFLTMPNFWGVRQRWRFLWRGSVNRSKVRDAALRSTLRRDVGAPHINTAAWTTLKYFLSSHGLRVEELTGYQSRVHRQLHLLPLASCVWLGSALASPRSKRGFELPEANRWSILFGSSRVFVHARKVGVEAIEASGGV